jgi:outer membrane protein OmpU
MDKFKKVGLTALAGSLAAVSANAAEMSVSGATLLTYTSEDPSEVTGNPYGMKTNIAFTASGDVNGYTVSYYQFASDKFAGMSSASLTIDMGDMGTIRFDQGAGSGLSNIDDMTPTAAEEIWDGLDTTTSGRVGATSAGAWNFVKTIEGYKVDASYVKGGGGSVGDGASTGAGAATSSWDVAVSGSPADGWSAGVGYGSIGNVAGSGNDEDTEMTVFANYSMGMATVGYQRSDTDEGTTGGTDEITDAWGVAINVNDNLSISYGEREIEFDKATAADVTEKVSGVAIAYTMGSIKIAGNMNEGKDLAGVKGADDQMTEIALSFAF